MFEKGAVYFPTVPSIFFPKAAKFIFSKLDLLCCYPPVKFRKIFYKHNSLPLHLLHRLGCSWQIRFHWQSPQIFVLFPVSIIFFCTASVNSGNASFCPSFKPHSASTALSYLFTFSAASQIPWLLFGQAEQISSVFTVRQTSAPFVKSSSISCIWAVNPVL